MDMPSMSTWDVKATEDFETRMKTIIENSWKNRERQIRQKHMETTTLVETKLEYLKLIVQNMSTIEKELADYNTAVSALFQHAKT